MYFNTENTKTWCPQKTDREGKKRKLYAKQNVRQKRSLLAFCYTQKNTTNDDSVGKNKFCVRGAQMPHDRSQRISNLDCLHMLVVSIHNVSLRNALFSYVAFVSMLRFVGSLLRSTTSMRSVLELALVLAPYECVCIEQTNREHLVNEIIVFMVYI